MSLNGNDLEYTAEVASFIYYSKKKLVSKSNVLFDILKQSFRTEIQIF